MDPQKVRKNMKKRWEEKTDTEMTDGDMSVPESTAGASGQLHLPDWVSKLDPVTCCPREVTLNVRTCSGYEGRMKSLCKGTCHKQAGARCGTEQRAREGAGVEGQPRGAHK